MSGVFPFSGILGQQAMQSALLISAVDPSIGGVLIRGQKGTAKSTAARALASLLPPISVVSGCSYHYDPDHVDQLHHECEQRYKAEGDLPRALIATPFVDLPLSTTEDRLVGTLHLEKTLREGRRHFETGLFAAAHRGILYVDEVNLLPDHLVDLLLDTAASGENLVEREGLRQRHASQFLLIGTMNPEEGELRPQFLDRFGLCVTISSVQDPVLRREIVMHRMAFDQDRARIQQRFAEEDEWLRQQLKRARLRLLDVSVPQNVVDHAVSLACATQAQGHRAELALVRAARAMAALMDRNEIGVADIHEVASLALAHRIGGPNVLTPEQVQEQIASMTGPQPFSMVRDQSPDKDSEPVLMENMDFPGSAAAGSTLFTYLKKKMKTATSRPMKPSI
jgi:Mg-chelatase subunit ChlI